MKIRLMGTLDELAAARKTILAGFTVLEFSEPRANRGASALYRQYFEVHLAALPPSAGQPDPPSASQAAVTDGTARPQRRRT